MGRITYVRRPDGIFIGDEENGAVYWYGYQHNRQLSTGATRAKKFTEREARAMWRENPRLTLCFGMTDDDEGQTLPKEPWDRTFNADDRQKWLKAKQLVEQSSP